MQISALIDAGFRLDQSATDDDQDRANQMGMSDAYPYKVLGVYLKDGVRVTLEQNTSADDVSGLKTITEHPPVAVVDGPGGRCAVNPEDTELLLAVAADLA